MQWRRNELFYIQWKKIKFIIFFYWFILFESHQKDYLIHSKHLLLLHLNACFEPQIRKVLVISFPLLINIWTNLCKLFVYFFFTSVHIFVKLIYTIPTFDDYSKISLSKILYTFPLFITIWTHLCTIFVSFGLNTSLDNCCNLFHVLSLFEEILLMYASYHYLHITFKNFW